MLRHKARQSRHLLKIFIYLSCLLGCFLNGRSLEGSAQQEAPLSDQALYEKGVQLRKQGKITEAMTYFKTLAVKGNVKAQHNLGSCYYHLSDQGSAYAWFKAASDKGFAPSTNNLQFISLLYALLPDEILLHILSFLDGQSLAKFRCVSKQARLLGADTSLVLAQDPADVIDQLFSTPTMDQLYRKITHTQKGLHHMGFALQKLYTNPETMTELVTQREGFVRLLALNLLLYPREPEKSGLYPHLQTFDFLWKPHLSTDNPSTYFNYGWLMLARRLPIEATKMFDLALKNGMAEARYALGLALFLTGEKFGYHLMMLGATKSLLQDSLKRFASDFSASIAISTLYAPGSPEATFLFADILYSQNNVGQALVVLQNDVCQTYAPAQVLRARIMRKFGNRAEKEEADELIKLAAKQRDTDAMLEYAKCLFRDKNYEKALKWLNRFREGKHPFCETLIAGQLLKVLLKMEEVDVVILKEFKESFLRAASADLNSESIISDVGLRQRIDLGEMQNWCKISLRLSLNKMSDKMRERAYACIQAGDFLQADAWGTLLTELPGCTSAFKIALGGIKIGQLKFDEAFALFYPLACAGDQQALDALYKGGLVLTLSSDRKCLKQWLEAAATLGHTPSQCVLGRVLVGEGERAEGRRWLKQAGKLGNTEALKFLGDLACKKNKINQALYWYKKAAELGDRDAPQTIFNLGLELIDEGKRKDALACWEAAAKYGIVEGYCNMAAHYERRHQFEEALTFYQQALQRNFLEVGDNVFLRGFTFLEQGDLENGIRWLTVAAEHGHANAQFHLGWTYLKEEDYEKSKVWLNKAATNGIEAALSLLHNTGIDFLEEENSKEAEAWWCLAAECGYKLSSHNIMVLGQMAAAKGEWDQAKRLYGLAAQFGQIEATFRLGLLAEQENVLEEAATWYEKAAQEGHPKAIDFLCTLGNKCEAAQNEAQALDCFRRAAKLGSYLGLTELGRCAFNSDRKEEAKIWFMLAALRNPKVGSINLNTIGHLCSQQTRVIEARTWFLLASQFGLPEATYNLGLTYLWLHDVVTAQKWLWQAIQEGDKKAVFRLLSLGWEYRRDALFIYADYCFQLARELGVRFQKAKHGPLT